MSKKTTSAVASTVRRRAAALVARRPPAPDDSGVGSGLKARKILHELQVHQVELEMQNDELVRSRAELEAALARYADLYDSAPVGYFTLTTEGTITEANLTAARMWSVPRARLLGRRLGASLAEADRGPLSAALARTEGRPSLEVSVIRPPPAGPLFVRLVLEEGHGERGVRVAAVDLTERKAVEERLVAAQKMEAIGRLAGGVAHDFNNLLTVILAHASFGLQGVAPGSEVHEDLTMLQEAASRAADLTRQLLAFSRKERPAPRRLNASDVVTGLARMLGRIIGEGIELAVSVPPEPLWVEGDAAVLEQVMMNLVLNARDAMPQGGRCGSPPAP